MKTSHKILAVLSLALLLSGCTPTASEGTSTNSVPTTSETTTSENSSSDVVSSEESVTSSEESIVSSSEENTSSKLHLGFEDETLGDITETKTVGDFKLIGTSAKPLTIAESQATVDETVYTKGIKTNGSSSTTKDSEYRVIEFTTTGAGTVKIVAKSGNAEDATRTITILNKNKGVTEDAKAVPVDPTVLEFTLHSEGTFLIASSNGIWYFDIEVNYIDGTGDKNWMPPIETTNENNLIASEIGSRTLETNTPVGIYTILAGEGKDHNVVIDGNNKTCNNIKFTHRIKLGGIGSRDERCIKFSVTEPKVISIYAMSSSSSADRAAVLVKLGATAEEDTVVETVTCLGSGLSCFTIELTTAGDYVFYGTEGGVNVYGIYVEAL